MAKIIIAGMGAGKIKTLWQTWVRSIGTVHTPATGWGEAGLDLLLPPRCANCDADLPRKECDVFLCETCVNSLAPSEWMGCLRCGAPLAVEAVAEDRCVHCRGQRLHFDAVIPLGSYRDQLRLAVLRMKRPSGEPLAAALGSLILLRRGCRLRSLQLDMVVPVPMYWARRIVRGTNSPEILAARMARGMIAPFKEGVLRRRRSTKLQPHLRPAERFGNVRNAFELGLEYDLTNTRVLLVDDVLTTGATASEAAKVLKRAGAAMVAVAVVARAEGNDAV